MSEFICPVCSCRLYKDVKSYCCEKNHSFDISSKGYVNLLLSNHMNAKFPGDNKTMVEARRRFLDKGYYKKLSDIVNQIVNNITNSNIVDAGCGEGYYTTRLKMAVPNSNIIGFDISKFALMSACNRNADISYAVASLFSMPIPSSYADVLINLFAPLCSNEFNRILKEDGTLIIVAPGKKHLWGLKSFLYEKPYENILSDTQIEGFTLKDRISISYTMQLKENTDIIDVFSMTPYYWKTPKQASDNLFKLNNLETLAEFEILVYNKSIL